jgi:alpha-amylase/alpha-mannosidase (GH57 family)
MDRFVCVHGHFYQPPRENAWLEAVEVQDSAYPYHDWNERISAECYAQNASSRLLDGEGKIRDITNNYGHMSFNFGPTLLSWLETEAPEAYGGVLEGDKLSLELFGHGSAMAQAYNHLILPLGNSRDKRTQVLWGLEDFRHRFGREPEGMWLPETAVDLESLDLMAQAGMKFALLSPHQASRVRPLTATTDAWQDVTGSRIDPTHAYLCRLRDGRSIALFFYDGPVSQAIAFENLLSDGQQFAGRLLGTLSDGREGPQLANIATDGESYGHHFKGGDMALAYALESIEHGEQAGLMNYAAFLEANPPTEEVEIIENSSWSCIHGIERWRSDCGCNTGGHPGWNQAWRAPLRQAMDWLRDELAPRYEQAAAELLKDPWAARDAYISVILDRSPESLGRYLDEWATHPLSDEEKRRALGLLELQRHALLMFTSCGWFFDEVSGLETVQVMQYAARAIQLGRDLLGEDLEPQYLERLAQAKSNLPENRDGRLSYDKFVKPSEIDLTNVAAHFAISSLFFPYQDGDSIYSFRVDHVEQDRTEAGSLSLLLGNTRLSSVITLESGEFSYGVLHLGDQNLVCKLRPFDQEAHGRAVEAIKQAFSTGEVAQLLPVLDEHYGETTYSMTSLFRDPQRQILEVITGAALRQVEETNRSVYEQHAPLLMFLSGLEVPPPKAFHAAAELVLNADLRATLSEDSATPEKVGPLLDAAARTGVQLDGPGLGYVFAQSLERLSDRLAAKPSDPEALAGLLAAARLLPSLPFPVDLRRTQNNYHQVATDTLPAMRKRTEGKEAGAQEWMDEFGELGGLLSMRTG